ncbi:very short patch repair endonuclease [Lysobacter xinjiangensis]|uniref:Very short patch repair endonuclease n=2 Tax=Cognatilysobacter xinjiangensis TaxID=546892 RepID=A0ABQ3C7S4_9GAMM|nr:very short patch repair endonuclease [Lysobacter xinjiangensis]
MMRAVKGKHTKPELLVRSAAHRCGLRFRIHKRDLPGSPDVVFPRHKVALFVHGCYWHRHPGCRKATTPATNVEFWAEKFRANVARDSRNRDALTALGWRVVEVWECEVPTMEAAKALMLKIFKAELAPH